jgi:hypothetical protein
VNGKEFRISITDMLGNTLMDEKARSAHSSFTKRISLSGFAKGIYLVKVENGQEERTEKLVVK